jgi:hypothetical protein
LPFAIHHEERIKDVLLVVPQGLLLGQHRLHSGRQESRQPRLS